MDFSEALDKTLICFGITGKWLAAESGVSAQMISGFRRGQQRIYTDSFAKILSALPDDAQKYFFELVRGQSVYPRRPEINILDLVDQMNPVEMANLLNAIADRLTQQKMAV